MALQGISITQKIQDTAVSWHGMASVFWDSEGVTVEFLPYGVTINAQHYSNLLYNDLHQAIHKKRPGKQSKIILLFHIQ
jgi:23S rRNA G2445 N2-methylase RlmL